MYKLFIDCETSGLDPVKNQVLTTALVICDENENVVSSKELKLKQIEGRIIDEKALEVNKINLAEHNEKALPIAEFCLEVEKFLTQYLSYNPPYSKVRVYGHNVKFDLDFLKHTFNKTYVEYPFHYHYQDTMIIAVLFKDLGVLPIDLRINLGSLCAYFGINAEFHNALEDTVATAKLYFKMLDLLRGARK